MSTDKRPSRAPLPPPHVLAQLVPDSPAFNELLKIEQKLDWTLSRKKAEINDALGSPIRVPRTLRVFISSTMHQGEIPGWKLRIEGRLLDSGNVRLDKTRPKFSTFVKSVIVEMDNRDAPTYPEGNVVEWHPNTPLDGFEVMRRGDTQVNCRIVMHINHQPERFKVLPPLADLTTMREGTRSEVMAAVWKLVKISGAQDKEDGSIIRPVGGIEHLTKDPIPFHQLPELATRYLIHPDPVIIPCTIGAENRVYDIPIEIDDPAKSKIAVLLRDFEGDIGREIVQLEDKVGELAYFSRDLKQKRDFLEAFAANPAIFIQNWLQAQARDLDEMLGYQIGISGNGGSVKEEDLRRSDLFNMPWVDEAIAVHEAARMEMERRR